MTRREVIRNLEGLKIASRAHAAVSDNPAYKKAEEALNIALADLRGHTREQVEAWKGAWMFKQSDWTKQTYGQTLCSKCSCSIALGGPNSYHNARISHLFCPRCGSPMTDEAVDIVMKRLEALKDAVD